MTDKEKEILDVFRQHSWLVYYDRIENYHESLDSERKFRESYNHTENLIKIIAHLQRLRTCVRKLLSKMIDCDIKITISNAISECQIEKFLDCIDISDLKIKHIERDYRYEFYPDKEESLMRKASNVNNSLSSHIECEEKFFCDRFREYGNLFKEELEIINEKIYFLDSQISSLNASISIHKKKQESGLSVNSHLCVIILEFIYVLYRAIQSLSESKVFTEPSNLVVFSGILKAAWCLITLIPMLLVVFYISFLISAFTDLIVSRHIDVLISKNVEQIKFLDTQKKPVYDKKYEINDFLNKVNQFCNYEEYSSFTRYHDPLYWYEKDD